MAVELTVDQRGFVEIQARLKAAGATGLRRELNKELKLAAADVQKAEQAGALALPSTNQDANGLRQSIADNTAIRISRSKNDPGVTVYVKAKGVRGALGADTNRAKGWRHPVFGTKTWVQQTMSPGWWGRAASPQLPKAKARIKKALDDTARKIAKG